MNYVSNVTRSAGDPKILHSGPSSQRASDRLGRALGWFSLGLGVTELVAPRLITRTLGMEGSEGLVRAYGVREIGSGILSLSLEKRAGLWSRVAGDAVDLATLATGLRPDNPKRGNVSTALVTVLGLTLLDLVGAQGVTTRHSRRRGNPRDYRDRSGFPQGINKARGAARDFRTPPDMRAAPAIAGAIA